MTEIVSQVAQPSVLVTLGINGKLFLAQLVNFGIIFFVVWRWVYRPLLKTIDARDKKIATGLANAEEAKRRLAQAEEEERQLMRQARQEAQAFVETARTEAAQERKALIAKTEEDVKRQLEELRAQLNRERASTVLAVKKEVVDLMVVALERLLPNMVQGKEQREIMAEALKDLRVNE